MNRLFKFSTLTFAALFFTGCAISSDKLIEKEIEALSGGDIKVSIDSDEGTSSITGKDGSTITTGEGNSRPAGVPEDLPNISGASNFSWFNISGSGVFSYEILNDNDYNKACTDQMALLNKAGWTRSDSYEMDVDKAMIRSFAKPGYTLMVTCSDNTEEGSSEKKISITLNTGKTN